MTDNALAQAIGAWLYAKKAQDIIALNVSHLTVITDYMIIASGRTAAQRETLFRPASYRQMLRNAQVHDRDGNLRDGENSVTPGILH